MGSCIWHEEEEDLVNARKQSKGSVKFPIDSADMALLALSLAASP